MDGVRCRRRGSHRCLGRARHVLAFFTEALVHTKGPWAGSPFIPAAWQRDRILTPLFGDVEYSEFHGRYVRRYRILYLLVARKNGKSELLAGICLYLLIADGEQGAELYGLALDMGQAGLVWSVARQMVRRNPDLRERLKVIAERIVDEATASFFTILASDAGGALGANPSGAYIDELLTQPNRELFDAIRTGFGARAQPMLLLATTAESESASFAATERKWSERVATDPSLEPERLVVIYSAPMDADWTAPATWRLANPALGDFLEVRTIANECRTAQANPPAERSFRQFRLNQVVNATDSAIDLPSFDRSAGMVIETDLVGRRCYGGLDLATTTDLAALAWDFPEEDGSHQVIWRLFCPEAALTGFDRRTGGQASVWARSGFLEVSEGNVIDYQVIRRRILADAARFDCADIAYDPWNATMLVTELMDDLGDDRLVPMRQGFASMSAPTKEFLRLIASGKLRHGGNPAVRFQASNAVTRTDPAGNLKLDKSKSTDKIDGLVAAVMALDRCMRRQPERRPFLATSF